MNKKVEPKHIAQPENKIRLHEVKTSKLAVDDGVGSFKVSFNLKTLKQHGVSLDDIANIINRLAEIEILPYQLNTAFKDPKQTDAFNDKKGSPKSESQKKSVSQKPKKELPGKTQSKKPALKKTPTKKK